MDIQEVQKVQEGNRVYQLSIEEIEEELKNQKQPKHSLKKCCLREGCEDINSYKRLNKIHEGNYGVVYRALQIPTGTIHAVKKLKMNEGSDFPITSLR